LRDGDLSKQVSRLARIIAELALDHDLEQIISFDPSGFDGHDDHKAVSLASAHGSQRLGLPQIVRVNSEAKATLAYTGNPQQKIAAMALHASQYDLTAPHFWDTMGLYEDQLHREWYAARHP
jgi:LmbE family N-acetylglucosaminyl deacetylase